ncbi:hypothetical protein Ciccas_013867 [Cichlidogyrus casuarinus]|uniref:Uncharacterized protein n=1 Tax=Cichlidogyrus casuarinus TaxID=1844966 RepID=A0ABD2PMH5_9PLAT
MLVPAPVPSHLTNVGPEKQPHSYTSSTSHNSIRKTIYNWGRNLHFSDRSPMTADTPLLTELPMLQQQQQHMKSPKNTYTANTGSSGIIPAGPSSSNASPPSGIVSPMPRRSSYHPSTLITQVSQPLSNDQRGQLSSTTTWHSGNTRKHFQHNSDSQSSISGGGRGQRNTPDHVDEAPSYGIFQRATHRSFGSGRVPGVASSNALVSLARNTPPVIPETREDIEKSQSPVKLDHTDTATTLPPAPPLNAPSTQSV